MNYPTLFGFLMERAVTKRDKKQSETLIVCEKMFSFESCIPAGSTQHIRTEKSSNNKTANFVRVPRTRSVHEDNQTLFATYGADCLFICMCTGRLAVPVVVWMACGTHFFINLIFNEYEYSRKVDGHI